MARGKQTCKILKEIRRQIAEANDIEFITSECRYKGDCLGTCPKCEAEVRYLEQQLRARSLAGKAVALAGISTAALAILVPMAVEAHLHSETQTQLQENITVPQDTLLIKGRVLGIDTMPDGSISKSPLIGALILNERTGTGVTTNLDGEFNFAAAVGDSLKISYIGYNPQVIVVTQKSENATVTLVSNPNSLTTGIVVTVDLENNHFIDLNVFDEDGQLLSEDEVEIRRIWTNEEGKEDSILLSPSHFNDKQTCRIYWQYEPGLIDEDGNPIKEATLSIEADDYEPKIIKVKYPKTTTKKTIRLKRKKN